MMAMIPQTNQTVHTLPARAIGRGRLTSSDVGECAICTLDMEDRNEVREMDCSHWLHRERMEQWGERLNQCPYCRRPKTFNPRQ
ncbi:hypothetical protein F5Y14DRAFT_400038 [Nemania sp. NC0429]|nr:hypothetical protein F5Y14DRAFT_400038 [Nemania sp. NC0429]